MGLDMFLTAKKFIWSTEREPKQKIVEEMLPEIKGMELRHIEVEAIYWRKANHIHKWFVDNVQNGVDECETYPVSIDKLKELLAVIERVLTSTKLVDGVVYAGSHSENGKMVEDYESGKVLEDSSVAEELLPTQDGFFFGNTEYDEYYWRKLEDTATKLKAILSNEELCKHWDFEYHSSW